MKKSYRLNLKKVLAAVMAGLTLAATVPVTPVADWFHASYKVKAEIEKDSYDYKLTSKEGVTYIYSESIYDENNGYWDTKYVHIFRGRDGSVIEKKSDDTSGIWGRDDAIEYETSDGIVYVYVYDGEVGDEEVDDKWSLKVVGYKGEYTEILTIPSEIDGQKVKSIGGGNLVSYNEEKEEYEYEYEYEPLGYSDNYHIMIIEEGIETIESGALQGNHNYEEQKWFQLPESIKSIGSYVFDYQDCFSLTVSENLKTDDIDENGDTPIIGGYQGGFPQHIVVTKANNEEGIGLSPNAYGEFQGSSFYLIQNGVTISDEFIDSNNYTGYLVFDYSEQDENKLKVKSIQNDYGYTGLDPIYINGKEYTFEKELTYVEEEPATCAEYGEKAHYEDQFGNKYLTNDESTLIDEEWENPLYIEPTEEHTDDGNGRCSVCGKILDEIGAKLAGYSLSLDGSIGVNFYMELDDSFIWSIRNSYFGYQNAYMKFTLPNGSTEMVKVIDAINDESHVYKKEYETSWGYTYTKSYYMFQCHVPAKEMTGTIRAQIIVDEENGIVGTEYTYSVKDYADYLLTHIDENESFAKAADVVKSMLIYGAYAQKYFGYHTENYAYDLNVSEREINSISSDDLEEYSQSRLEASETENVKFAGTNLSLLSETTLRLFFNVEGSIDDVKFTYNGKELDAKSYESYYYVELDNIAAKNLSDMFVIEIADTVAGTTGKVIYSPMSYAYLVLSRPTDEIRTEDLKMLMKAFYNYNIKAIEYFQ